MQKLHIGLINNMPDAALQATERQFAGLLHAAAGDIDIELSLYALPDVPRGDAGRRHLSEHYLNVEALWQNDIDALIVTGAEPVAQDIVDEPYWGSLSTIIDWAEANTYSSIWSCMAAHAAVRSIDGIRRHRLTEKRFGVFECVRGSDHALTAGSLVSVHIPHSRWNDIREDDLTNRGYRILRRASDGGVDSFIKQSNSLFVFFQGHLEYDANTLLLEYRRDVGRFLRQERDTYPTAPHGYLTPHGIQALTNLQARALANRREELLGEFPVHLAEHIVANAWRTEAVQLYSNWLNYLCEQKLAELESERFVEAAFSAAAFRNQAPL